VFPFWSWSVTNKDIDTQLHSTMNRNFWGQTTDVAEQSVTMVGNDKWKIHQSC
jgi:hypothetical protein